MTTTDGIELLRALKSCELAQADGALVFEACELAAAAHGVDVYRLQELFERKLHGVAEARAAVAGARWADE